MIAGVNNLGWILFPCIISLIHYDIEAEAGNLCCNPSFLTARLGAYNSEHVLADTIRIKSTLRLLSGGGGDGESSSNGNDNEINETKKKEETLLLDEQQDEDKVHIDTDFTGEPIKKKHELLSSLVHGNALETSDKEHYSPEEDSIQKETYSFCTKDSDSSTEPYSYASIITEEEETIIHIGDALNNSSFGNRETRPLPIPPVNENLLDDNSGLGDSFKSGPKVQVSNASNVEMIDDMEEEWFFHDQIMDIADTENYDDDNNDKKEECDKEAIHDGNLASYQKSETTKNLDHAIAANTDKMVNNTVGDTEQPINLDVQHDVIMVDNRDFSTTEEEVIQDDELLLRQSSTITNELRSVLKNLSYKSYEIDAMKPNIASAIAQLRLRRPVRGMPETWSTLPLPSEYFMNELQEKNECDLSTSEEKETLRHLAHKVFKKVLLPCAGIILAVYSYSLSQSSSRSATTVKRSKTNRVETHGTPINTTTIDGIIIDDEGNVLLRANTFEGLQQKIETSTTDLPSSETTVHRKHWFDK